jgi:hypothetical protein
MPREEWSKSRSHGMHFNDDEMELIRKAFTENRHPRDVARELGCTMRSIQRYYQKFRGNDDKPRHYNIMRSRFQKPKLPQRHYQSSFEPD